MSKVILFPTPTINFPEAISMKLTYRGQNYSLRRPVYHFNPAPLRLKYRGVAYSTAPTDKVSQVLDLGNFIPSYV